MAATHQLIAVVGPTGAGKTALAVRLAREFNGVLISADSRQIFRGLDIGTNKEGQTGSWHGHPARIIDGVPQLLIDVAKPGERFTLHDWLTAVRLLLPAVWADGKLPIIVGGTGLYVSALVDGYVLGGGRHGRDRQPVEFESLLLQVDQPRETLYERSDQRFERVFDAVVAETKALIEGGVSPDWLERLGLDYRFASYFLSLTMNRQLAIEQFQQASRAYIRRQLTWWRHHGPVILVRTEAEAIAAAGTFLS